MIAGKPFMKLKLIATIAALVAIPAVAYAQQGQSNVPKPTKADVQKVVQTITGDKEKAQVYCDLSKTYDQMQDPKLDSKTLEALDKRADALVDKLGPEYSKMADGMDQVDLTSSEGKEFLSILSELNKLCDR
jgi:hypothetical protein